MTVQCAVVLMGSAL